MPLSGAYHSFCFEDHLPAPLAGNTQNIAYFLKGFPGTSKAKGCQVAVDIDFVTFSHSGRLALSAVTVACVLKSGGIYKAAHVKALRDGVERHLTLPHRFVCLADKKVDCEHIPLTQGWKGWWSKIELFDGRLTGPVFYLDLDTRITGSLDNIVLGHHFTVLRNFWAEAYREPDRIGSGLMAWNTDLSAIYRAFAAAPRRFMREYVTTARWGDQAFVKEHTPIPMGRWQDKHPGKVVSFKKHVQPNEGVPEGASVVVFHGPPRPWEMKPHEQAWFEQVREVA